MSHTFIPEYIIKDPTGDTHTVPVMIKTHHALAKYILRDYVEGQLYPYTHKGKVQFMIDVIESQDGEYTLSTCIEPLSKAIVGSYDIFDRKGVLRLNSRNTNQLCYIIKKLLETSIQHFK
jgi:hypothetical protein